MRTIKDIIDAERWEISGGIDDEVIQLRHNVGLARIEDAVTKHIAELENLLSLAEENKRFHRANIEKSTDGSLNICWGEHEKWEDCEYVKYYPEQRIAELEAQVPKVISPKNGTCMCGNVVRGFDPVHYGWKNNYCPNCGAKLNWEGK